MKLKHKDCANCGNSFDSSEKGITEKVWAKRLCCSRKCGAIYRNNRPAEIAGIDTGTALFRFVSGLSMMEILANQ
jgi:rubredoxin